MPMRVTFAGQVGIDVDGVAVDLTGLGRVGRLFWAYLASERHRPVPKDELAEVLWGDDELPASWEPMLRGNASKLRTAFAGVGIGPAVVVSAFGAYQVQLPPDAVVDVEEAEANVQGSLAALAAGNADDAARAAAVARAVAAQGFLPGWSGIWVERRQAEVGELHLRALEALARADCRRSMWSEAVRAADEAVAIEPFRESAVQVLMDAHRGAGNVGEALRAYERCRRTLAEELGVNPSAATEAAYLSLLGDEPAQGIGDAGNRFHYYRLTADDRVLFGGYDALYFAGGSTDPRLAQHPATFSLLAEHLVTTFPQLADVAITHTWGGMIDTCSRFSAFWGRALRGRVAYVAGFTGLGVGASHFGARTALDLLDGRDTERTRLSMVRTKPVPFPPEPVRWAGIQLTRHALARADEHEGRRGPWLRTLDRLGLGFDS